MWKNFPRKSGKIFPHFNSFIMFPHFKNSLFGLVLLAAFCSLNIAAKPVGITPANTTHLSKRVVDPILTVTISSATSVSLSWDSWPGLTDYSVTVTNLTTQQVEQSFTTPNTSASVIHLTSGDTYRFSVARNGFVIAEDIIL